MCLPDYLIFCTSGLIIVVFPFALVRHYCFLVLRETVLRARVLLFIYGSCGGDDSIIRARVAQ
jgi:hypothetical protein